MKPRFLLWIKDRKTKNNRLRWRILRCCECGDPQFFNSRKAAYAKASEMGVGFNACVQKVTEERGEIEW